MGDALPPTPLTNKNDFEFCDLPFEAHSRTHTDTQASMKKNKKCEVGQYVDSLRAKSAGSADAMGFSHAKKSWGP